MSGEAKTVSELCREALELREKATQGLMEGFITLNKKTQKREKATIVWHPPECPQESLVLHEWKVNGFCPEYWQDVYLYAFAANHIKQIAERCLELEDKVEESLRVNTVLSKFAQDKKVEVSLLKQENQKLREALGKALDQLEVFNFAKDPMRVSNADTILRDALKGGQDGNI